jgi:HSP20 family molecular chaperone IbpA
VSEEDLAMSETTAVTKQADTGTADAALMPPVNVYEDAAGITLYADLPGVPKDKLVVQVEGDVLTIKGEVVLAQPDDMEASYTEVSLPRYRRVFTLSKELDAEKVVAEFNHGVLKLRIPKAEFAQPSRIEVKVA